MPANRVVILAAVVLLTSALLSGCTSAGGTKTLSSADPAVWLESGGLEQSWSRASEGFTTEVSYGSEGAGTTHGRSTNPGVPGATAAFPFSYSVNGAQVTIVFQDEMLSDQVFEVTEVSGSSFTARSIGATGTLNHGTWTR